MDAYSGRFLSIDPWSGNFADPASLHKYVYAHNRVTDGIDPSGESYLTFSGAVVAVGAVINVSILVGTLATGGAPAVAAALIDDLAYMLIPGGGIARGVKQIAKMFERSKRFKIGYEASGTTLAHNLRQFGHYGPNKWPAHHIVPGSDLRGAGSRDILGRSKVDINSPINGIFLDPGVHAKIHTTKYYTELEKRLLKAEGSRGPDGVRDELTVIYQEIAKGEFP